MNFALIEDGRIANTIWLLPTNSNEFPNAVICEGYPVQIGDQYIDGEFYREGEKVMSVVEQQLAYLRAELAAARTEIDANRKIIQLVADAGGIREEITQSDKIGFDWRVFYVNDIAVRKDYVEQEIPFGTADNPIIWKEGMSLIPNAYYTHDGVRKVWMGEDGIVSAWDNESFVEL